MTPKTAVIIGASHAAVAIGQRRNFPERVARTTGGADGGDQRLIGGVSRHLAIRLRWSLRHDLLGCQDGRSAEVVGDDPAQPRQAIR